MLRRVLLASAGALALSGAALAADLPTGIPPPVYLPPPPVFTWTGLYLGGQLGYAWGKDNGDLDCANFPPGIHTITSDNASLSGAIGGAHIGYNWQIAQFVLGVEAGVDATNFSGHSGARAAVEPKHREEEKRIIGLDVGEGDAAGAIKQPAVPGPADAAADRTLYRGPEFTRDPEDSADHWVNGGFQPMLADAPPYPAQRGGSATESGRNRHIAS